MNQLLAHIEQYKKEITAIKISSKEDLESFRIKYLGTKGILKNVMGEMKNVPIDQKKEAGQLLNEFKLFVESNYEALANSMETTSVMYLIACCGLCSVCRNTFMLLSLPLVVSPPVP